MAAGRLVRASVRLVEILGEERSAVAGGVAVNAHGFVRATRDVDVIVTMGLPEARRLLEKHGVSAQLLKGDPLEGDFPCLKGILEVGSRLPAVPFDVLPELVPFGPDRSVELSIGGRKLRIVDLETLIRLKLKAGGPKDLYDVAILVNLHPAWEERARALAAHDPSLVSRLATVLDSPRTRGQAREIRRQNEALDAVRRRRKGKSR